MDDCDVPSGIVYYLCHHGVYKSLGEILMSRAKFDTTMDVYYGPTSVAGPPGVQYASAIPCRVVRQQEILQLEFPDSLTFAWVTYDALILNFATITHTSGPVYSVDYGAADTLVIPSGGTARRTVLRAEYVDPVIRPAYRRALICDAAVFPPLPPPPPVIPGVDCSTAHDITIGDTVSYPVPHGTDQQWWRWTGTVPSTFHVHITGVTGSGCEVTLFRGFSCGDASFAATVFDDFCYSDSSPPPVLFARITNFGTPVGSITITSGVGPC